MRDDYLWDRSGPPDGEIARLEELLQRYRYQPPAARAPLPFPAARWGNWQWIRHPLAAAAALALLVLTGAWLALRSPAAAWEVARVEGAPRIDSQPLANGGRLRVGETLETDAASRARLRVGQIGEVALEPNSRLRLLRARWTEYRLGLDIGRIHARIWAPPRLFFVETPSAVAVDLGCAYTLEVDEHGAGVLRVEAGWVGFEHEGRESFVPAGAMAITRPGLGPGTPYFEDAAEEFRAALVTLDFELRGGAAGVLPRRAEALQVIVDQARARDALTLWHLLSRTAGEERARVYDRMAALAPPPKGVTRPGILRGDRQMLDAWWDELGLDSASWWRLWKGPAPRIPR